MALRLGSWLTFPKDTPYKLYLNIYHFTQPKIYQDNDFPFVVVRWRTPVKLLPDVECTSSPVARRDETTRDTVPAGDGPSTTNHGSYELTVEWPSQVEHGYTQRPTRRPG
jgi:hypothetical protein